VSAYFERARKDPFWNLANTTEENTSTQKETPRKAKTTPRKARASDKKAQKDGDGSGDEDFEVETPSKKTPLNKVQQGRVAKPATTRRATKKSMKASVEDDNADFGSDLPCKIKGENGDGEFGSSGSFHSDDQWAVSEGNEYHDDIQYYDTEEA
jgi:hypothetical protein